MEGKDQAPPPINYGFQQPPPAYDQSFNQAHAPGFVPQQQPVFSQPPYNTAGTQVITVIQTNAFGPDPTTINCPSCRQTISTRVDYESSTKTHLFACLICLLCWPCFWIPYTVDSCKNANHYCPSCGSYLGTYHD